MKTLSKILALLFLFHVAFVTTAFTEERDPFEPLIIHLKKNRTNEESLGWIIDRTANAKIFNQIRNQLGNNFEAEVLKFVGNNIDRHYNVAMFLESSYYLENNRRLPELALLIYQEGIELIHESDNQQDKPQEVSFRVLAAILSYKTGLESLASSHKAAAERLIKKGGDYEAEFPAISRSERIMYDSIVIPK